MITPKSTPSQINSRNHLFSVIFDRYGISTASGQSLEDICSDRHLNAEFLIEILSGFEGEGFPDAEILKGFPIETLLDYLQRTHDYYLHKRLPELEQALFAMIMDQDEPKEIRMFLGDFYGNYRKTLFEHIRMEEFHLFPYIRHLINAEKARKYEICDHVPKGYSIEQFVNEHDDAAERDLTRMKEAILSFEDRSRSLSIFRVFISQLEAFERDMSIHAFIEDEVLIPLCRDLEISGKR